MKVKSIKEAQKFQDIPNVGPRVEDDFRKLGFKKPLDLKGKNPFLMYKTLCVKTKSRQDPCVLDVFMAVVDFANGAPPKAWFSYTKERKKKYLKL
jgi:hypothetical protein